MEDEETEQRNLKAYKYDVGQYMIDMEVEKFYTDIYIYILTYIHTYVCTSFLEVFFTTLQLNEMDCKHEQRKHSS